jgi:peptidoglycan/xylan/chitin deacetylase (PgdA/CDA1 family)
VYLTFDDGPGWDSTQVQHTNNILDTLKQKGVKATFFVLGGGIADKTLAEETWNDSVMRIVGEGHSWGMHGWDHEFATVNHTQDHLIKEMQQLRVALEKILGSGSTSGVIWRAPGGLVPDDPDDAAMIDAAQNELGLGRQIYWNVDSLDYKTPNDPDQIHTNVVEGVKEWWGIFNYAPVVLLHSIHEGTAKALPGIIQELKSDGFAFYRL